MDKPQKPIETVQDHRAAVDTLVRRIAVSGDAGGLVAEIERVVRFELERGIVDDARLSSRLAQYGAPAPRRTALISDIHGNREGLDAIMVDIERQRCDRIVCLGDLVEGGPENEHVIEMLLRLRIPCVRGNHDEINDISLSAEWRRVLQDLPERIVEDDVLYTHISPRPIKRKIDRTVEAWNVFEEAAFRLMFVGHVHIPYVFGRRSTIYGEATRHTFEYNRPFELDSSDAYIISVGAVGYGRDGVGKIRYGIYDRQEMTVELRAIDGPLLSLDYALR